MSKRQVILALAAVLVLAIAIPAVGSGGSLFNLATHANKKAKRALDRASRGLHRGSHALSQAGKAQAAAAAAQDAASQVSQSLNATEIVSSEDPGTVTTDSPTYVGLGGPSVVATARPSGLVDVWAKVDVEDNSDGGAVALFADGQLVPGQAQSCDPDIERALMLWEGTGGGGPVSVATPSAAIGAGGGCGTLGPPGPVQIHVSPGTHTFELRYADPCPCGTAEFSHRVLRVGPRL